MGTDGRPRPGSPILKSSAKLSPSVVEQTALLNHARRQLSRKQNDSWTTSPSPRSGKGSRRLRRGLTSRPWIFTVTRLIPNEELRGRVPRAVMTGAGCRTGPTQSYGEFLGRDGEPEIRGVRDSSYPVRSEDGRH